ncbi:SDR family NAD(P)-dependent oxidoreductase [uncultured Methanobrevibacter sp.]|uniref:SDR family NAD(P)-dependent oxidoreductase n=1 Tax=uncultured Methanobrevibacter sp. TaxID=253161 RepID=UPI0026006FD5|nr:SDR family oxidoreductase [uncultured Methanobrevibacter sp.]
MKNYFDIKDRIAVITGGSSGLGVQIAKAFASQGVKLALFARREDKLKAVAEEIADEFGVEVMYAVTDVTDYDNVEESVQKVIDKFGRIDILVNSAGVGHMKPALEQTIEEWDKHLKIDLSGVYYASRAVGKFMVEQKYGKIINLGSIHSRVSIAGGGVSVYTSSKGGVKNLTQDLAVEWAPYNITVNAIGPAYFASEMTAEVIDSPEFAPVIQAYCPMGRVGAPGELDGIAIYLASDASSFCTGQLICIDGGWTSI